MLQFNVLNSFSTENNVTCPYDTFKITDICPDNYFSQESCSIHMTETLGYVTSLDTWNQILLLTKSS